LGSRGTGPDEQERGRERDDRSAAPQKPSLFTTYGIFFGSPS
jgi:hypothetical protein